MSLFICAVIGAAVALGVGVYANALIAWNVVARELQEPDPDEPPKKRSQTTPSEALPCDFLFIYTV